MKKQLIFISILALAIACNNNRSSRVVTETVKWKTDTVYNKFVKSVSDTVKNKSKILYKAEVMVNGNILQLINVVYRYYKTYTGTDPVTHKSKKWVSQFDTVIDFIAIWDKDTIRDFTGFDTAISPIYSIKNNFSFSTNGKITVVGHYIEPNTNLYFLLDFNKDVMGNDKTEYQQIKKDSITYYVFTGQTRGCYDTTPSFPQCEVLLVLKMSNGNAKKAYLLSCGYALRLESLDGYIKNDRLLIKFIYDSTWIPSIMIRNQIMPPQHLLCDTLAFGDYIEMASTKPATYPGYIGLTNFYFKGKKYK